MKYLYTLLLTIPLLFASCLKDQDDIFDKSSSERVQEAIKEARQVLISAENGWKMDIYPSKTREYGGYTLLVKFEEEEVTVASELVAADSIETSLWLINASAGPVLSFDSYNSLMHYFSGPNKDKGNIDAGLEGDSDFIILEATKDRVKLKGTKTGNINYLTPNQLNKDWETLVKEYQDAADEMGWKAFIYQVNGKEYSVDVTNRNMNITYPLENGFVEQIIVPYIFNLDGISFYEPLKLGGVEVSRMIYKNEGGVRYFEDANGSGAKLIVQVLALYEYLLKDNWYFAKSKMGSTVNSSLLLPNILLALVGYELEEAFLGSRGGYFGLHLNISGFGGSMYYSTKPKAGEEQKDDEITLEYENISDSNGDAFYSSFRFSSFVNAIGGAGTPKTYTLTADNPELPKNITFTDKANSKNTFTLSRTAVRYPMKN